MPRAPGQPIYQTGDATYTKHFAQSPAGQWHYRIRMKGSYFGRWIRCEAKSEHAWYNPAAGSARIKEGT